MRLYNGCPDSALAAVIKSQADARARARSLGYCITWFPAEEKWAASYMENWDAIGPWCNSAEECLVHVEKHHAKTN